MGRSLPVRPEFPTAMQLAGPQHDTDVMVVGRVGSSPGIARSGPHVPSVSVVRNPCGSGSPGGGNVVSESAAVQLPGVTQEIASTSDEVWVTRSSVANIAIAVPKTPSVVWSMKG
jgi:hypothetical protein